MGRLQSFLLGLVVGAAGLHVATNYYVVRSNQGVHLVPKLATKLENPYYDIRNYSLDEWQKHQPLALALVKAKRENLFQTNSLEGFGRSMSNLLEKLTRNEPVY